MMPPFLQRMKIYNIQVTNRIVDLEPIIYSTGCHKNGSDYYPTCTKIPFFLTGNWLLSMHIKKQSSRCRDGALLLPGSCLLRATLAALVALQVQRKLLQPFANAAIRLVHLEQLANHAADFWRQG